MFGIFRKNTEKAPPPPELEVKDFQQGQLEVLATRPLANGSQAVILKFPEGEDVAAKINVESGLEEQLLYWAVVEEPVDLEARLVSLFAPVELPATTWEEKRGEIRAGKVLGVMSRDIPGFKTVSHDVSSRGVRIVSEKELPVGRPIQFRLDLDDHRIEPLELVGDILWCQAKDPKGYWLGVKFTRISEKQQEILDKFLEEARNVEHGVITRDYAD